MPKKADVINIADAKARLPELLERASKGEEIILARNGKPKARLVPISTKKEYVYAAGKGKWQGSERVLDSTLPSDLLAAFYDEVSSRSKGPK